MKINKLELAGFRNYHAAALEFDEGCNVIYGENAQGKTNLLEAIVYLACGKSPRAHADRELIGFEKDCARLFGVIESREREFKTEIVLQRGRRRKMTVNGEVCTMRGKKLRPGDDVEVDGAHYSPCYEDQ